MVGLKLPGTGPCIRSPGPWFLRLCLRFFRCGLILGFNWWSSVTAQELVGDTGERSKILDKNTLYKERAKGRRKRRLREGLRMWCGKFAVDYGFWGRYDPPNFGLLPFLLRVAVVAVCLLGQWGTEVDTSAGNAKRG